MTAFDERERAFEAKFAHDAEMVFRAEARAVKNLALWAGRETGRSDAACVDYARGVMAHWLGEAGFEHLFARLAADGVDEAAARRRFDRLLGEAKADLGAAETVA